MAAAPVVPAAAAALPGPAVAATAGSWAAAAVEMPPAVAISGRPADCKTCLAGKCCSQAGACAGNADCAAFVTCARACPAPTDTSSACVKTCITDHNAGGSIYNPILICMQTDCGTQCPPSISDGRVTRRPLGSARLPRFMFTRALLLVALVTTWAAPARAQAMGQDAAGLSWPMSSASSSVEQSLGWFVDGSTSRGAAGHASVGLSHVARRASRRGPSLLVAVASWAARASCSFRWAPARQARPRKRCSSSGSWVR